jgi:hypothetical protein
VACDLAFETNCRSALVGCANLIRTHFANSEPMADQGRNVPVQGVIGVVFDWRRLAGAGVRHARVFGVEAGLSEVALGSVGGGVVFSTIEMAGRYGWPFRLYPVAPSVLSR